jgi:hypothetical protein
MNNKSLSDPEDIYYALQKFCGKLANIDTDLTSQNKKQYKKSIVNKWHLLVRLDLNKELIPLRKHNLKKKKEIENKTLLTKIKSFCKKKEQ